MHMRSIFKRPPLLLGINTFAANIEAPFCEVVNSCHSPVFRIPSLYFLGSGFEFQSEDQLSYGFLQSLQPFFIVPENGLQHFLPHHNHPVC
jgi:hypothetical protein